MLNRRFTLRRWGHEPGELDRAGDGPANGQGLQSSATASPLVAHRAAPSSKQAAGAPGGVLLRGDPCRLGRVGADSRPFRRKPRVDSGYLRLPRTRWSARPTAR